VAADASEWLVRAGLDVSRFRPLGQRPANAEEARCRRFCPYSGQEAVVFAAENPDDFAVVGLDAFTTEGRIVRYTDGGNQARVCRPTDFAALRGTQDLLASCGLAVLEEAAKRDVTGAGPGRRQLAPGPNLPLKAVAARHGRLYFVDADVGSAAAR
jgi:hypothetical protein